ncbi:hypothetical protein [Pseudomonas purpurea]|uniref:hypothetical protein n=1 Tax=Pseudomonas purpurea TaxID=3136737 RepID=UPI0032670224
MNVSRQVGPVVFVLVVDSSEARVNAPVSMGNAGMTGFPLVPYAGMSSTPSLNLTQFESEILSVQGNWRWARWPRTTSHRC